MPVQAHKKAAIKRASKEAREQTSALDTDAMEQLTRLYANTRHQVEQDIKAAALGDNRIKLEQLGTLKQKLERGLDVLAETQQTAIEDYMRAGAIHGSRPFSQFLDTRTLKQAINRSVLTVRSFNAKDGLQLSDRLWRINSGAKDAVIKQVERVVTLGQSASQATQEFLRTGQPIPAQLTKNINAANPEVLARKAGADLMTGNMNPYDQAKRVFRTEINRTHGLAYQYSAFSFKGEDEDVIGTRFLLSPNHREKDICDMHAKVNRYGLGKGVYPKGKSPWPAHPNTISYEEVVFTDEVTDEDKQGKQTRIDWLLEQTETTQYRVLRAQQKVQALQVGALSENQISTPWKTLEKYYQRKGIDINKLKPLPVKKPEPPPKQKPVPKPAAIPNQPQTNTAKPVSDALDPIAHKTVSRNVLNAIDSVHTDGVLDNIPIASTSSRKAHGYYQHESLRQNPIKIAISTRGDHKELTLAHEIGHFIDHRGIHKGKGFASSNNPLFAKWREAVTQSKAVNQLTDLYYGSNRRTGRDGREHWVDKQYVSYTLRTHEIWARAYAQYIAQKSRQPKLLAQLHNEQERITNAARLPYAIQWQDDDFKPIADAIDEIFKELGWIE